MYTNVKKKKAGDLGIELTAYDLKSTTDQEGLISNLNKDERVDGIMLQLPLTGSRSQDIKLSLLIDPGKDADGLNIRSGVMPATVRAVMEILKSIDGNQKVVVVGNRGTVGSRIVRELSCTGMDKDDFNADIIREADVVISCTGQERLIRPQMVKDGAVCIDVGYPHGDFDPDVAAKASFFTPVPGGVGPVTVAMLFANLLELVKVNK
jgi:methylenetetrahydrofolate dehydrogenase (NADP+)/methenyltetrahydrofolate cyclohydrolase